MIFDILSGLLALAIAALLVGLVLQLSSKIVCKKTVEFGAAWETAFFGLIGIDLVRSLARDRRVDARTDLADPLHARPRRHGHHHVGRPPVRAISCLDARRTAGQPNATPLEVGSKTGHLLLPTVRAGRARVSRDRRLVRG